MSMLPLRIRKSAKIRQIAITSCGRSEPTIHDHDGDDVSADEEQTISLSPVQAARCLTLGK
jgi:hypothetical protein